MATANQPSLKHFSASDLLPTLPSAYVSRDSEREVIIEEEVPVIDLSLLRGTQEERSQVVRVLGRACQEWGFFLVVNHGVPEGLRSAMLTALEDFFELPEEEKMMYTQKNALDPILFGSSNNVTEDVWYWRDFLKVIVHPEFTSPAKPPSLRKILQEYTTCTRELARELLKGIWESLELEISSMDDILDLNSCFQIFNGNLYPPCPQPELALGIPPHFDFGLLSVLLQNGIDGLQVKHNDGWVNVKALPNSFFINTGEHLEIISNGRYKSVLHRATLNNKSTRMSVVTIIGPSMETTVFPAPELVSRDNNQARYRAMKFGDYITDHQSGKIKEKLAALDRVRLPTQ